MRKILSYCLFVPKVMPAHRDHDKWRKDSMRYWFNLPALAITNKILYPDYEMRIYTSKNIWDEELSSVLWILDTLDNVEMVTIDMDYKVTEPAIWRMMPLWDREIEMFHTRDVDSLPTEKEYKYVRCFEKSACSVGTMRTHPNHYGIKCRMLAGLSSFKPPKVPIHLKMDSFYTYYAFRHHQYGSDQDLLIERFTNDSLYTELGFLDHCNYAQSNPQEFPCQSLHPDDLDNVQVTGEQKEVFKKLKECGLDNWAGEPVDGRHQYTNFLLSKPDFDYVFNEMHKNSLLQEFYGVSRG